MAKSCLLTWPTSVCTSIIFYHLYITFSTFRSNEVINPPKILPPDWLPLFMKTNTTQCSTFTLAVSMVRKYYFKCGLAAYHSHHPSSCKLPFWPFSSVSGPTLQSLPVYFQEQQLRLNSEGCLFSLRLIPSRLKTFCTAKGSLSPSLSFFALTLQGP